MQKLNEVFAVLLISITHEHRGQAEAGVRSFHILLFHTDGPHSGKREREKKKMGCGAHTRAQMSNHVARSD